MVLIKSTPIGLPVKPKKEDIEKEIKKRKKAVDEKTKVNKDGNTKGTKD